LPSKRGLIRNTNKIKVNFGNFQSKLVFPRNDSKLHISNHDLYMLENDFIEQSQKFKLLEHVEKSGLISGDINNLTED